MVKVNKDFIKKSLEFSRKIIEQDNQYHRLVPAGIDKNSDIAKQIAIQRTFMGKIGECAFLQYLWDKNKSYIQDKDMFSIFEGKSVTDTTDFFTTNNENKKIDIKTSYFDFHIRLIVNHEQINASTDKRKDIYVGVKVNLKNWMFKNRYMYHYNGKDKSEQIVDLEKMDGKVEFLIVDILGYEYRDELVKKRYLKYTPEGTMDKWDAYVNENEDKVFYYNKNSRQIEEGKRNVNCNLSEFGNLGEGNCKWVFLEKLEDINRLLRFFK
ncbi:hypothetical protein [Clostridium baratii]|uniref:hypothetical protein n=1 Tax=Clostridium baratii TaxID=1561 RepID=UPI003D7B3996